MRQRSEKLGSLGRPGLKDRAELGARLWLDGVLELAEAAIDLYLGAVRWARARLEGRGRK